MKHIKYINENFQKINEKLLFPLFKNEKQLKEKLFLDKKFANGKVSDAIIDIIYNKWQSDDNMNYDNILEWTKNEYGIIPYFTLMFSVYVAQVYNGGHSQYYGNGYASTKSRGFGYNYENIDLHEDFVKTFNDLNMVKMLPYGQKIYNIISSFTLDLESEIEQCSDCGGSGVIECEVCQGSGIINCPSCDGTGEDEDGQTCSECDGSGDVDCDECFGKCVYKCDACDGSGEYDTGNMTPDINTWCKLDTEMYEINDNLQKQYDNYLKTLMLDGEKISNLIDIANSTQKYNI